MTRKDLISACLFGLACALGWLIADHIQKVSTPTFPAMFFAGMFGFLGGRTLWK